VAARDSQDITLVIVQNSGAVKVRESQDIQLGTVRATTAKVRDSQEISLSTVRATTAKVRDSQEILLAILKLHGAYDSQEVLLTLSKSSAAAGRTLDSQEAILAIYNQAPIPPPDNPCYNYYLSLITSQYKGSANFLGWLQSILQVVCDIRACINSMQAAFDIDTAIGVQLDILGQIIGVGRVVNFQPSNSVSPILDDATYRILLKATIAQNQWNGQIGSLYSIWNNLFPGGTILFIDNQNMTATITLAGAFTSIIQDLILNGLIVPRPETVLYQYFFATLPIFGVDQDNSFVAGADKGHAA